MKRLLTLCILPLSLSAFTENCPETIKQDEFRLYLYEKARINMCLHVDNHEKCESAYYVGKYHAYLDALNALDEFCND